MKKITYNNKQYVLNDPQYPVEETVTDADMNEIKEVVNYNANESENVKDALIHITTEKSDNLNVKDASGQNGSIDVFGISKQETRSGKNLLENEITYASSSGVSYVKNNDGSVVVNGTANPRSSIILNTMSVLRLKANTQYRLTGCPANGSNSTYMIATNVAGVNTHYDTGNGVNFSFEEDTEVYIEIRIAAGTTISNLIFYPMVRLANNGDDTYEQYGAMPSPRFISDIENITGDIDITTSNKNFADPDAYNYDTTNYKDLDINLNDNEFTISTDSLRIATEFIKVPIRISKNGTYTFGLELKTNTAGATARALVYDTTNKKTIGTMIENNTTRYNKKITTITIDNTVDKKSLSILLYCNGTVGNAYSYSYKNIFVNEAQDTEFIKHEGQLITFPLEQNQKLMQDDYLASDGIHNVRDQIEFDGTENWQVSGGKYYLQISNKKIRYSLTKNKMLCSHFKETAGENPDTKQGEFFEGYYATGNRNVFFNYDNGVGGLANWKSYLAQQKAAGTPVILEYELEAEEVEAYTEEQQEAYNQLQNAKTYKTVTNVFTDKADMILKYVADTKTYIDNKYNALAEQILNLAGGN